MAVRHIGLLYVLLQNKSQPNYLTINTQNVNVLQPYLHIRHDCLVYYQLPTVTGARKRQLSLLPTYCGKVTSHGAKRIRAAIDVLLQRSPAKTTWNPVTKKYFPFRINFVTLTVSAHAPITANFGYSNLMKPFLRKLRTLGNFSYVWKAELQKRGQLHYHLATNTFLPWQDIRSTWNNLQRKNRLLDDYAKKNRHYDANSTDVHALHGIVNIGTYLSKYLAKDNTAKINGKTWDCSIDCKQKRFAFTPTNRQEMQLRQLQNDKHAKVIELDHCTIFKLKNPGQILTQTQQNQYLQWLS